MFGIEVTQQALFYGVVFGLIYAVFAAGFVLVYRCTGVLNFAQGEIFMIGGYVALVLLLIVKLPYAAVIPLTLIAVSIISCVIPFPCRSSSIVRALPSLFFNPAAPLMIVFQIA